MSHTRVMTEIVIDFPPDKDLANAAIEAVREAEVLFASVAQLEGLVLVGSPYLTGSESAYRFGSTLECCSEMTIEEQAELLTTPNARIFSFEHEALAARTFERQTRRAA